MPPLKQLNFITGNTNKLAEVKNILGHVVPLQSQSLDLTEIQGTIEEISRDKSQRAAAVVGQSILLSLTFPCTLQRAKYWKIGGPVLTEDTCLCFNALKDLPGPYMYVRILQHLQQDQKSLTRPSLLIANGSFKRWATKA